jgi:hypothetical protein
MVAVYAEPHTRATDMIVTEYGGVVAFGEAPDVSQGACADIP